MKDVYVQTASFSRQLTADFHGSLEKIAAAGYTGLELFNKIYGGYSASELKRHLDSLGLSVIGAHNNEAQMTDADMAYLAELGCPYLVCPGLHVGSEAEAHAAAEQLNAIGRRWKQYGKKLGYHNHSSDYDPYGDKRVIDILMEETDPELVFFELDVAWSWRNGVDAAEFIRQHAGRFELIHIKETSRVLGPEADFGALIAKYDIKRGEDGRLIMSDEAKAAFEEHQKINCRMGDGIIQIPAFVEAANAQGVQAYIVEREYAYTGDIFSSLAEDIQYLQRLT